jgi:pyrimidine nucleoside transport protein
VIWGIVLQLILGLLILRTEPGKTTFSFLGKQVEHFQSHVLAGETKINVLVSRAGK